MERIDELQPPDVLTSDTDNATKVHPREAPPGKRQKFRRFRGYNTGLWNGPKRENKEAMHRQDNLHLYDSLASSLGLTDYQKSRGRMILDDLDIHELGKPVAHIAFGVCTVVANADCEDYRYWPHPNSTQSDDEFERVAADLDMTRRQQLSVVQQVLARTEV